MNPLKTYVKLSAVLMFSNGFTKGSLAFLNYPAQIMFKSTKVNSICNGLYLTGVIHEQQLHDNLFAFVDV